MMTTHLDADDDEVITGNVGLPDFPYCLKKKTPIMKTRLAWWELNGPTA